ncbi:MAG: hypothetical protein D6E12_05840 [Desulfovibrio sp.]|nr:MAG: hypothetical protein D6E12_05840 [Desulfovibrio sp.]
MIRARLVFAGVLMLVLSLGGLARAETLAIVGGTLIDGSGAPPVPGSLVLVEEGVVTYAGPLEEMDIPEQAHILDATGGTVVPGLVDAHAHLTAHPDMSPRQVRRKYLLAGVTLACDLGSSMQGMARLAQDPDGGDMFCRVAFAGPVICAPGGYPGPMHGEEYSLPVQGPDEARQAVRLLHEQGATLVKLAFETGPAGEWPVLDQETARAIVDKAHGLSMLVRVHVEQYSMLVRALDAGVDIIEHLPHTPDPNQEPRLPFTGSELSLIPEYQEQLTWMASRGIAVTPTLTAASRAHWSLDGPLAAVAAFHEAEGRLAVGTDSPFKGIEPGLPLEEMELLLEAGLSPMEVIAAATRGGALACNRADLGLIRPGMAADLVVVDGDPLMDITALSRLKAVVKAGQIVTP